jgi:hypothetical protein
MTTLAFDYSIRLPLAAPLVSPNWLGSKFLTTLDALTEIDANIFPDWEVIDLLDLKVYPLAVARPRIAEIIPHNALRDEYGHPQPEDGYCAAPHTTIATISQRMRLSIGVGDNTLWLKTGDWKVFTDPAIVTFPLFKAALLAIHSIWPSPWACAQAFRSNTVKVPTQTGRGYRLESAPMIPAEPTFPRSVFHIPWIAYLSAPLAFGIELPPEIQTERTSDGGLLMIATEERLDPDLPEHARRARILAETLIACTATGKAGKQ